MKDTNGTLGIEGTDIAMRNGCFGLEIHRELKRLGELPWWDLRGGVRTWERT